MPILAVGKPSVNYSGTRDTAAAKQTGAIDPVGGSLCLATGKCTAK
jgi:hypothetical protein